MKNQIIQYYIDKFKSTIYRVVTKKAQKIQTPMTNLMMQLELKNILPHKVKAVELFGMHGLWHTLDYVHKVDSLDIFEIDKTYHELSKKVLKKHNVNYFNTDSLKHAATTSEKYNFIVADIPYGGAFYDENGLPIFWDSMLKIADQKCVFIFNIHSDKLKNYDYLVTEIKNRLLDYSIKDLFFVPRNTQMSYIVLVIC